VTSSKALKELDRARYLHPFTNYKQYAKKGGNIYTRADGIFLYDTDGNELLDGMSGLWCTNLGYSQSKIIQAVTAQLEQLPYYNSFFGCANEAAVSMADELTKIMPDGMDHVFFTNSGSEANDTNIRLVHRYFDLLDKPNKKIIISRENAYHGSTIAAASLGGMSSMHKQFIPLPYIDYVPQPYAFAEDNELSADEFGINCAQALADKIDALGADNVAAFIAEPIQGAGGVIVPPASYWPAVQKVLDERDVLFISDEVICGFCRTGSWFGSDHFGTKPDLITFAKGVTNGYQPLGGVGVGSKVAEVLLASDSEFSHGFTYSGHPAACAAGLATLEIYHELGTIDYVSNDIAPYWQRKWQELRDHPIVGETRTLGMLGALELVREMPLKTRLAPDDESGSVCRDAAMSNGLMVRAVGDSIISAPPLICTRDDIDLLVDRLTIALDLTAKHYGINTN
jgi:putrescine aminotransferase